MLSDQPTMPTSVDVSITPIQQMICSCTGALITSTCMTPLDVVKIRLQAQQKTSTSTATSVIKNRISLPSRVIYSSRFIESLCLCSHCSDVSQGFPRSVGSVSRVLQPNFSFGRSHLFKGALETLLGIVRVEGVSSLWSGLSPTLVMAVPGTVIYFTTYDRIKYKLGYREGSFKSIHIPVLAGSIARVVAVTVVSPLELIRTKMQSARTSYSQLSQIIRLSIKNNGLLFLMRGLGPSLLRDVPFSAIYWFGYESAKAYRYQMTSSATPGFLFSFLAGSVAGTVAAVVTLPFDVIKTHRQIEIGEAANMAKNKKLTSTWNLMANLYRRNGISALFAGIIPRVIKVAPACAIMISIYEFGKSHFRERNAKQLYYTASDELEVLNSR